MLRPSARRKLAGTSAGSGASRQTTGSNSERQRPVGQVLQQRGGRGRVHAGAGQDPAQVLDHVRAGPGALLLLRQRDRLLRRAGQLQLGGHRGCPRRACAGLRGWLRLCQTDGATDASGTPRVRASLSAQPACTCARSSVPCLALRVLKLDACARCASSRWDGARPYRCSNRAARARRSAVIDSRREENRRIISPLMPVISKPWPSSRAVHSRPNRRGEGFFQVLGDDRGDRADVLVVAQRVRGPPFPVGAGPGDVGDLGVDVQLHVAVAGGVLQPVRHRQVGLVPLAGLPAVDPGAVGAGAGVAGLPLEVAEPGVHGLPDHVVDLGDQGGPVLVAFGVAGLAGQAGVLAEGGVEDRDALGQRQGQVEEQRALPGLADSLGPELALAFGGGVRLGGQQRGVQVGGLAAAARRPAQLGAVGGFALAEQQVIRFALDPLAGLEAERLGAGAPPAAGRLSAALAGLDVVAGRVLGRAAVDLLPDVVKVIALAQGRDNRQPAARDRGTGRQN